LNKRAEITRCRSVHSCCCVTSTLDRLSFKLFGNNLDPNFFDKQGILWRRDGYVAAFIVVCFWSLDAVQFLTFSVGNCRCLQCLPLHCYRKLTIGFELDSDEIKSVLRRIYTQPFNELSLNYVTFKNDKVSFVFNVDQLSINKSSIESNYNLCD